MGSGPARIKELVVLVVKDAATGKVIRREEVGPNIVTTYGDKYYAQRGAGTLSGNSVTRTFSAGMMVVAQSFQIAVPGKTSTFRQFTGIATTLTGRQLFDSGYPKTADSDTDNTGRTADAVTYKRTYSTTQANYVIKALGVCQRNVSSGSSAGLRELLSAKTLSVAQQITKTGSQTLVVYVNHTFQGV
jgi:hypothetical protein